MNASRDHTVSTSPLRRCAAFAALALALGAGALAITPPHVQAASAPGGASFADASGTATPTPLPIAGKVKPAAKHVYVGVFRPPAPYTVSAVDKYKSLAGKPAAITMWFQQWSDQAANRFDSAAAVALWKRGSIPLISWEPWPPCISATQARTLPDWSLATIVNGKHDAYITQYADDVKAAGGPVMISLMHEMNGVWYPWAGTVNGNSPAQFVAAWRHVHDIFVREGATNVTWVWSVNLRSRPDTYANRYAAYYPGNSYVDWVGVSGFNWGVGVGGYPWWSFETMLGRPLKYLKSTKKPVIITEMSSVEQGGSKAAWIKSTYKRIRTAHPEIKAVVWYDHNEVSHSHTQVWRIDSSKSSLAAFRSAMKSTYYLGCAPCPLPSWHNSLSASQWSSLLAISRLY